MEVINRARRQIIENQICYLDILRNYEWHPYKPWFHDEYSKLLDKRKHNIYISGYNIKVKLMLTA